MDLCDNCHGGCCRRYKITLFGSDIIRICENLKVDMFFFIDVAKVSIDIAKQVEDVKPLFIFTDAGEDIYFEIFLKFNYESSKHYSQNLNLDYELNKEFSGTLKCMFLQEWNAQEQQSKELSGIVGRCGIYDIRPLACRSFPAGLYGGKVQIKDPHTILEKEDRKPSNHGAYALCERELEYKDFMMDEQSMFENVVLNNQEMKFYIQLAKKWNANPDVSDKFYEFLKKEYSNRIEHIK